MTRRGIRTKVKVVRRAKLIDFPRLMYTSGLLGMLCRCSVQFDCGFRGIVGVLGVGKGDGGWSFSIAAALLLTISPEFPYKLMVQSIFQM